MYISGHLDFPAELRNTHMLPAIVFAKKYLAKSSIKLTNCGKLLQTSKAINLLTFSVIYVHGQSASGFRRKIFGQFPIAITACVFRTSVYVVLLQFAFATSKRNISGISPFSPPLRAPPYNFLRCLFLPACDCSRFLNGSLTGKRRFFYCDSLRNSIYYFLIPIAMQ